MNELGQNGGIEVSQRVVQVKLKVINLPSLQSDALNHTRIIDADI